MIDSGTIMRFMLRMMPIGSVHLDKQSIDEEEVYGNSSADSSVNYTSNNNQWSFFENDFKKCFNLFRNPEDYNMGSAQEKLRDYFQD